VNAPPSVMKAVLLLGHGGFDQLAFRDDVPVPRPGPSDVLIRVAAAAVNNTDINTRTAWYSRSVTEGTSPSSGTEGHAAVGSADAGWTGAAPTFPRIQGADACGFIVAVGSAIDRARIGERVLVEPVFFPPGDRTPDRARYFGSECDGAFAEYATVPARHAHRISSSLSDAELACFPCSYSAAENMLTRAALQSGEHVLITGASGGVGSAAVQLALARRARVTAIVAAEKVEDVRALGEVRVVSRGADLIGELGAESMDLVVDVVGGRQFPSLLGLLKRGGRYAVAGAIAGPVVELDLRTLYLKDLRLFGCTVLEATVFPTLIRLIESGLIRPILAKTFPLDAIVEAQTEFLAKRHTGKIILLP
jgi:NADPH:quinone reductase-like Zn-dependent oxidoreductase